MVAKRLSGPHRQSGNYQYKNKFFTLPGFKPLSLLPSAKPKHYTNYDSISFAHNNINGT
jgi:hypothetical protein